jgi:hypothetical protein
VTEPERVRWFDAAPDVLAREQAAMAQVAPEMQWRDELPWRHRTVCGWEGPVPVWAGTRPAPGGLSELLAGRHLTIRVLYREAYPMVPPILDPIDPIPDIQLRTLTAWHVAGDGTLCTVQTAQDWQPGLDTAADLVRKASGWFIEYLLMKDERIDAMTIDGIIESTSLDDVIGSYASH